MAVETRAETLKIIREADGLEVDLLPLQGLWTEAQYLKLTDQTNHRIEFTDGVIELLPMPTDKHQVLLQFVFLAARRCRGYPARPVAGGSGPPAPRDFVRVMKLQRSGL